MDISAVTLAAVFKAKPGQFPAVQALFAQFREATKAEPGCIYYHIAVNEESGTVYFREAYKDADGVKAHVGNVMPLLGQLMAVADVVPGWPLAGPADQLEQLRELAAQFGASLHAIV